MAGNARTEGYSIKGSQAKSVALNCGGSLSDGNRFSVSGPVRAGSSAAAREAKDTMSTSVLMHGSAVAQPFSALLTAASSALM